MSKKKITQKRLKELLHYDPETGIFTWIVSRQCIKAGSIAGSISKRGYNQIKIDNRLYRANRLAWLYVHGYFPENDIDHKDRIPHHDWIDNLREATQVCNQRNTGNRIDNTSGVKGVSFNTKMQKWVAQLSNVNKKCHLGFYNSFDNAICARLAGEQCLNWSGCDSSSPAFKYVQEHIIIRKKMQKNRKQPIIAANLCK